MTSAVTAIPCGLPDCPEIFERAAQLIGHLTVTHGLTEDAAFTRAEKARKRRAASNPNGGGQSEGAPGSIGGSEEAGACRA